MCGIAGVVGCNLPDVKAMLARMRHRGPDHTGTFSIKNTSCHLGHVRLSIIDPDPRSNQPFVSPCGRYVLTFNGEIYNFLDLRKKLEGKGITFKTRSDTEVLLYWLIRHGVDGLRCLEGMFAFAFADCVNKTLLVARDQIGEKPLYYTTAKGDAQKCFAFASEIKCLLTLPFIDRTLDHTALLDYLRFLYTAPPNTLYRGIRELAPGHYLNISLSGESQQPESQSYYVLEKSIDFSDIASLSNSATMFRELFQGSVERRLVSDVNVGMFLSGGIDSNAILAVAHRAIGNRELHTFSLEYSENYDESRVAADIARRLHLPHVSIPFKSLDFYSAVSRIGELFDQPFGNATALASDMISAEAAKTCRVCLVGDGGDEVAIGYPRYHALALRSVFDALPRVFNNAIAALAAMVSERGSFSVASRRGKHFLGALNKSMAEGYLAWSTYLDTATLASATGIQDCETAFYRELVATFERHRDDPIRAATIVDMKSFVPFNLMQSADRTSMAHSLELRSPFLATPLVHGIVGLPSSAKRGRGNKVMVREALGSLMPIEVLKQKKRPFNPPIEELLRKHLSILEDYLIARPSRLSSVLQPEFVRREVADFRAGRRDNSTFLWGLATLEHWLRQSE